MKLLFTKNDMGLFILKHNEQMVQGFPVNRSYTKGEADAKFGSSFGGSQEKSTTAADGVTQTFAFTHTPKVILWNGQFQTLTDDYTVSSNNITFTGSLIPSVGDKIVNIYA